MASPDVTELNCCETIKRKIESLRSAVLDVPSLKSRTDNEFLLRFLRARKYNEERALELIKNYYWQKVKYPELYENLRTTSIPKVLSAKLLGFLPHRDKQGRAIFVFNKADFWDPTLISLDDVITYCLLSLERIIVADDVQTSGIVCLVNCDGFGFRHLRCCGLTKLVQLFSVSQNSFPARIRAIHVINAPSIFRIVFAMMKPLLKEKLKKKFFFHDELMSLHEFFPIDVLPDEFGGALKHFDNTGWNNELIENDVVILEYKDFGFVSETD